MESSPSQVDLMLPHVEEVELGIYLRVNEIQI